MSQNPPTQAVAAPYEETAEFKWTKRAFESLTANALTAETRWSAGVGSVIVTGPCPRCAHQMADRQVLAAVTGLSAGPRPDPPPTAEAERRETVVVDVTCGCGLVHAGAPEDVTGCGVSFRIELEAEAEGRL